MEWMVVKAFVSLCAVLGLMTGIVIVLRKYANKSQGSNPSVVSVEVLGHRMITQKRSVHVLKVLNKIIVVGVTEGGMTSLGEIDDDGSLREVDNRMALRSQNPSQFSAFVEKYVGSLLPNGLKNSRKRERIFFG